MAADTLLLWDISVALSILSAAFGIGFALGGLSEARRIRHRILARRLGA